MRKKIIKFYFFNNHYRNPAVNSLFSFSKRAMKQRKKNVKMKKLIRNTRNKTKKLELIEYYTNYMTLVKRRILLNQWSYNNLDLSKIFLTSFYLNTATTSRIFGRKNTFRKKLLLWFLFKLRYQHRLHKKLYRYTFLGYLSSHFVHTCARKNLTYQNRSKFRSKVFNTNIFSAYLHTCSRMLLTYYNFSQSSIYFFTTNPSKRYIWVDEEFYTQTSNWAVLKETTHPYRLVSINPLDYKLEEITQIVNSRDLLKQFFDETDKTKKDAIWIELSSKIDPHILDIIPYVYKMILTEESDLKEWYKSYTLNFIKHYKQLYTL